MRCSLGRQLCTPVVLCQQKTNRLCEVCEVMASEDSSAEQKVVIPGENRKLDGRDDGAIKAQVTCYRSAHTVADIVESITDCAELSVLKLSGNSLGVGACEAIAEAVAGKPTLKRALWSDMFVSRLKSEIPPALTSLGEGLMSAQAQLVELDLSDNAFGPAGVEAITALLTSPSCFTLRELRLNNNGLGIGGGKLLAKALLDCHSEAEKVGQRLALEVFVSGRNRLENEGATALSEVFEKLGTLLHVAMPQNGIHHEGVAALARALSQNPKLQVINLNDNTFTEEGSVAMAAVLPSLQELRVINFGDCLVRPGGARAIAEAIENGHQLLEELSLSYCELDQSAGLAVVGALANKDQLSRLELNGNEFGGEGVELLRESLEAKGRLEALGSLSDDEGDEEEEEEEEEEEGGSMRREELTISQVSTSSEQQETTEHQTGLVSLEDYFARPSGENLMALGPQRVQLIMESIGEPLDARKAGEMYAKVTSCYTSDCQGPVKEAVEEIIDQLLRTLCEAGEFSGVLNEILVQVGLIKSEDKKFCPVAVVDGPLLGLIHVIRQDYFPRGMEDVLITFLQKPSPILEPIQETRHVVLRALHTF